MGYFVDYEIHQLHLSINHARLVTSITLLGAAFAYPIAGMLADRLSHQRIFMFAAASMLVFVTPTIGLMQHHATMVTITASTLFLIALSALMQATISPLFAQVFHPEWRTTCCAISYNLGNGCSGATPMFALMMITNMPKIGLELVFLILVSLGSLGYLLAQLELKKKVTLSA
jgi:MFS family permease